MLSRVNIYRFISLMIVMTAFMTGRADIHTDANQVEADARAKALRHADNTEDSLKILLDVYDLSDKVNKGRVGMQILELAERSDNHEVMADMINELAASTDDTKALRRLIELSESIATSEGKERVETVLQMEQAKASAGEIRGYELQKKILDTSIAGMAIGGDPYKEIQNIYRALVYLGASSQGPMYHEYIMRLEDLVKRLPEKDYAIKNLYYTTAALFYTRKRDYAKAIESDRELLKQIEAMEKDCEKSGRTNYDFDYFKYVSYRRMLRNFRGLTPEQIEDVYAKCLELAERNDEVKETFGTGGLTDSYYFYATGQYDKAIPALKKALSDPDISKFRKQELLGLLAGAQNHVGDNAGELVALREFALMAIDERQKRFEDSAREVELRNTVNQLLAKQRMEDEKVRQRRNTMRKTSITLVYVLAVILIFVLRAYIKLRHKVKELESRNTRLRTNIEQIFDDGTPRGTRDLRQSKNRLKG